jgi:hypothetical protein
VHSVLLSKSTIEEGSGVNRSLYLYGGMVFMVCSVLKGHS